jgi:hypothetical protein
MWKNNKIRMNKLKEYYNEIIKKYKSNDYKVIRFNDKPLPKVREPHLEAQHFMMFEWFEDHNDNRFDKVFDYIVRPNNLDMDFTKIEFKDFLLFLSEIKIKKK